MRYHLIALLLFALSCADDAVETPVVDSGRPDSSTPDSSTPDSSAPDAASDDAGRVPPLFTCDEATPVSSGLERCDPAGYLRRVGPATCASTIPRGRTIEGAYPDMDECARDSDCADMPLGFCGKREGGNVLECIEGCETDADCEEGRVCFCGVDVGEPVGRCVPASCDSADDCAPGYECVANQTKPDCPSTRFECQTPQDSCASWADCAGFSPNPTFCTWDGELFGCSIAQCTQP